jgi:hypothetical protein
MRITLANASQSVGESFREFEFVWSADWLRWYVDGVMLFEEFIANVPVVNANSERGSNSMPEEDAVTIEFAYTTEGQLASEARIEPTTSSSPFRIKSLGLAAADPHDPFCRPRYHSEMNCREKTRKCSASGWLAWLAWHL